MTNKILSINYFKELKLLDTILYYDQPLLEYYTQKNDIFYLAMFVGGDGRKSSWYYIQVTESTMDKLQKNQIDLLSAFEEPVGGVVYKLIFKDNTPVEFQTINSTTLLKETLPDKGLFIGEFIGNLVVSSVQKF